MAIAYDDIDDLHAKIKSLSAALVQERERASEAERARDLWRDEWRDFAAETQCTAFEPADTEACATCGAHVDRHPS